MEIDIIHGKGYRIGDSDRELGTFTAASDGFVVLNLQNNKLFIAQSGAWTDGGTFPNSSFTQDQFDAWILS
jgi:hypothetical protein